jgi:pyruvate kinase
MAKICEAAERHPSYQRHRPNWKDGSVSSAMAHAAAAIAAEVGARAIIAFTESGTTALRVSKAHPVVPIIAASPHEAVLRKTALYSGVVPLRVEVGRDTDDMILKAGMAAVDSGLVRRGDRVVLVAGVPIGEPGQTNLVKVSTVG